MPKRPRIRTTGGDPYYNYFLRNARLEAGMNEEELARMAGVNTASINHYERLQVMPSRVTQERISTALGKSVEKLFPSFLTREYLLEIHFEREGITNRAELMAHYIKERLQRRALTKKEREDSRSIDAILNAVPIQEISESQHPAIDTTSKELETSSVRHAICLLPKNIRTVIFQRYYIQPTPEYREVGKVIEKSYERARQLHNEGLEELRTKLAA
ncbi:helix-turn-helix domain-containing protein [Candidatus Woesearchaeota archaeon]|nr:helix-turn-helix domain-containing protein [Candidatus Woesearchaeota archaeon]